MGFFSFLKYTSITFAAHLATSWGPPFENHLCSRWWNDSWQGNRSARRKRDVLTLFPSQIPRDLTWVRTRGATVVTRRLTA
jgi:hypothetical protein